MDQWDIIVVGAGIAGVSAVRTIAEQGDARVLLLNGERPLPYKRTRTSKNIARGFKPAEHLLESEEWYAEHGVTLRNDAVVTALDTNARTVSVDGEQIGFGKLILATGAEPVFPPTVRPHEADSFFVVRDSEDVHRLTTGAKKLKSGGRGGRRALVAGMGVLAVEVAEELRKAGLEVTLAGATPQLMPRQLSIRSAEILEELLTKRKVKLRFREEILSFERRKKGGFLVTMIRDAANFDMVVFCIGVTPRTELASQAGIETGTGILVDEHMQTSVPGIYAAGDGAEHPDGQITGLWHAAEYQGKVAALNALGEETIFDGLPFRLKCEVFETYFFSICKPRNPLEYGLDENEINGRYQCFYYEGEEVCGAVMVNDKDRAKEYERAVRERWSRDRVQEELALPHQS